MRKVRMGFIKTNWFPKQDPSFNKLKELIIKESNKNILNRELGMAVRDNNVLTSEQKSILGDLIFEKVME